MGCFRPMLGVVTSQIKSRWLSRPSSNHRSQLWTSVRQTLLGSNQRHPESKSGALPTELRANIQSGGATEIRTQVPLARPARFQRAPIGLSGIAPLCLAEGAGIEPACPFQDAGLASRCITVLPTFQVRPTGYEFRCRPIFAAGYHAGNKEGTLPALVWLREVGTIHRNPGYEPGALPTELSRRKTMRSGYGAKHDWYCVRGSNPSGQRERLVTSPEVERSAYEMVPPVRIDRTT